MLRTLSSRRSSSATTGQEGQEEPRRESSEPQAPRFGISDARHAVVATTQVATGSLIDDLRGAAADEGFQLVNVHGRRAFADLLYRIIPLDS